MKGHLILLGSLLGLVTVSAAILTPAKAETAAYEFSPPAGERFIMFRVNVATGEMGACQFAAQQGGVGTTTCFPPGAGAGPQAQGSYGLTRSEGPKQEGGVFRVNRQTGEISICYEFNGQVLCTPPAR